MNNFEKKNNAHRPTARCLGLMVLLLFYLFAVEEGKAQETASLNSNRADSVMAVLGENKEVVLYCGYEDEAPTYMVLCDYWKAGEGGKFEIWVLGYDLHTGDTVCLPIGPACIWIQKNDRVYNVGNYLSLDTEVKHFPYEWKVPQYSLVSCLKHTGTMQPTYHGKAHARGANQSGDIWNRRQQDDKWSRDMEQRQEVERRRQKEYEKKLKQQSEEFNWEKAETEKWQKIINEEKDKRLRKELKNF